MSPAAGEDDPRWVRRAHVLLDAFFVFMGAWTLLCWPLVFFGGSFDLLVRLSWLPVVVTAIFFAHPSAAGNELPPRPLEDTSAATLAVALPAAFAVVALHTWTGDYLVFWTAAVLLLGLAWRNLATRPVASHPTQETPFESPSPVPARTASTPPQWNLRPRRRGTLAALAAIAAVAIVLTLVSHRPDPDDSFYVNIIVTALDRPQEALLAHDGMHGETGLPLLENWYRLKSYEPLVATLCRLTGAAPDLLYYLVFPALFAGLVVIAHWSALRAIGGTMAVLGTAAAVAVIIVWGDIPQSIGNYGFVRLFQCKAVAVSLCVPAAVAYAARFAHRRDLRTWLLLCLCQVAAVGIAGSAVVAVPTTAAAALLGWTFADGQARRRSDDGRTGFLAEERARPALWGLAASGIVAIVAAIALTVMPTERSLAMSWQEFARLPDQTALGLATALGPDPRAGIALLALLVAPLLAPSLTRRAAIGYVLALLVLVLNPLVPGYLGRVSDRLVSRLFWTIPFPLLLGLFAQRLAMLRFGATRRRWPGLTLASALVVVFASVGGNWTTSIANSTRLEFPGPKVPPWHKFAGAVVEIARPDQLVLAPFEISMWTTVYRGHPRLVGVRPIYFDPLRHRPEGEIATRTMLINLMSHSAKWSKERVTTGAREARRLGVDFMVVRIADPSPFLAGALAGVGCSRQPAIAEAVQTLRRAGYDVWECSDGRK